MAYSKNFETQRAAGMGLYNISCAASNHIPMVKAEVVPALSHLGKCEDLECKKYSIMTLANIAANIDTRDFATKSGGM